MKKQTVTVVFFLCLSLVGCYFLLPLFVNKFITPHLINNLLFQEKKVQIQRITPWRIEGGVFLGNEDDTLSVPRFQINYSPGQLLNKEISSVVLQSAALHLEIAGNTVKLRGYEVYSEKNSKQKKEYLTLPFGLERVELKNCSVNLYLEHGRVAHFMVDGIATLSYENSESKEHVISMLTMDLDIEGSLSASLQLEVQKDSDIYRTVFTAGKIHLSQLATLLPFLSQAKMAGSISLSGGVETIGLRKVNNYQLRCISENLSVEKGPFILRAKEIDDTSIISIDGYSNKISATLSGLQLFTPQLYEANLTSHYETSKDIFGGRVEIFTRHSKGPFLLNFNGIKEGQKVGVDYNLSGSSFKIGGLANGSSFSSNGAIELTAGSAGGKGRLLVPTLVLPARSLSVENTELLFVLDYPDFSSLPMFTGSLNMGKIRYKKSVIAQATSTIEGGNNGLKIDTVLTSPLNEQFAASCRSLLRFRDRAEVKCQIPPTRVELSELSSLFRLPEDLEATAMVEAEMQLEYVRGNFSGEANMRTDETDVRFKEYSLEDISASLFFPDLPRLRTLPSQQLTISQLTLGNIRMSDAHISLRIDDDRSLFVEKARINWCGGRVETGALRFRPGKKNIETTLYCDRLSYTDLLGQLGVGDAEGDGALNGRLPLTMSKDGIQFDDGFLFSTPGNSGIVRFKNTAQIRQGMGDIERAPYLEYSLNALENFSYNWTKLRFNTEGDDLLLTMQLDGKPAEPLPYGYSQGQIVRKKTGNGLQHPIRLDVNFRLPLNELFRYGKNIQSMMEKR